MSTDCPGARHDSVDRACRSRRQRSQRVARRHRVGGTPRRVGTAGVRPTAVRPPTRHPLLVGYYRQAEEHRPWRGRHPAQASVRAPTALRSQAGRPAVLVHHLWLDDVELAGERPGLRGDDRPVRRQPGPPLLEAVASRRRDTHHPLRGESRFLAANAQAGVVPKEVAERLRSVGSARPVPRFTPTSSTGSIAMSPPTCNSPRSAAVPTSSVALRSVSRHCRCARGELQARALGMAVEAWNEPGKT